MINKQPAIYKLQSKQTGDIYVGGTRNAQGRKRQHEYDLRSRRHRNPNLQQAYINGDRFEFVVLEYLPCDTSDDVIIRREQEWKDFLKPTLNSRNAIPQFGSDIYISRERKLAGKRTTPQTEEEKRKRIESVKKYWATHEHRKLTPEEKQKISERLLANPPRKGAIIDKELRRKISDGVSPYIYVLVSDSGEEATVTSVRRFARERGLSETWLYQLVNGRRKNSSGWTLKSKTFVGYKKDR